MICDLHVPATNILKSSAMSLSASPVPVKYNERCENCINTITMFITLGGSKKILGKNSDHMY